MRQTASESAAKLRAAIAHEVERIDPVDDVERATQHDVLAWIHSGVPLCRVAKPADPPRHLVSYFCVVDGDHLLLVDHKNAQLWLPSGGHVEPAEHPRETVRREALEELALEADFLAPHPILITQTRTVGLTAGHTDVSLWYVLRGDRTARVQFDTDEFHGVAWFHKTRLPYPRTDPHLSRFAAKWFG